MKPPLPPGAVAWILLFLIAATVSIGACRAYPTIPIERRPSISSVVVFPNVIGPGDSVMVTVFATDPDGDTLVYDWITDARLVIKDDPLGDGFLYNTRSSSHVFYRSNVTPINDTAWVSCYVRDGRGGVDHRNVHIFLAD